MINRSASPLSVSPACLRRHLPRAGRNALAVMLPLALVLGGCAKKAENSATEARLDALEKKIDAAEKRSHQAISLAMQPVSAPPADAGEMAQFEDAPIEAEPEVVSGEDQDGIPASPALGPDR
ncbi:hypothetical protein [Novosphingobium sp.]|uniref:hypothetical protein n=1 Tax=Novosphingobium sp. TaxID=1874826 RepID=UPI002609493C|nr:hypothetical protein [Novosphingobium sp.]